MGKRGTAETFAVLAALSTAGHVDDALAGTFVKVRIAGADRLRLIRLRVLRLLRKRRQGARQKNSQAQNVASHPALSLKDRPRAILIMPMAREDATTSKRRAAR